ncbi:glycosylphosphatidylinositol anchor biosynthesis [Serendipita sp. 396]|nr:glycosylphosphatidylinositol anchor biosynthesis [Serendipita sp. 396]KAG8873816.1 glycosylphosphatidylinositol anchor biosynthesis [Serendipita sp. 405]
MKPQTVAYIAIAVRVFQSLATQTFFQPDEYFQSLEVAHKAVFGYGHLTWEWTIDKPIRSILFPALWMPVYKMLKDAGLDQTSALIWAPKILQGLFASLTDIAICRLSRRVLGPESVAITLVLSLFSFFHGLALVRSLSNSLETSLTAIALSYWPLHSPPAPSFKRFLLPLLIASCACAVRPTNAILWTYLCMDTMVKFKRRGTTVVNLFSAVAATSLISLSLLIAIDTKYFGTLTFTAFNFVRTNLSPVSLFYGGNPWHYYLTQAIPILLTTTLPLFLHGVYLTVSGKGQKGSQVDMQALLGLTVWTVLIYSLAGHKEWRFIHPVLPVMHLFCTQSLLSIPHEGSGRPIATSIFIKPRGFLVFLSLPAIIYTTFIHGRAQISVLLHLRTINTIELNSVGFLMPCHSTPLQSYLHKPELEGGKLWALGCEPPLGIVDPSRYVDQTAAFYVSPLVYLQQYFPSTVDSSFPPSLHPTTIPGSPVPLLRPMSRRTTGSSYAHIDEWQHSWPKHLVMFGVLAQKEDTKGQSVKQFLQEKGYDRVWRTWNGFEEDEKRRGGVEVWKWSSP